MRYIGLVCVVALVAGSASARGSESSRLVVPLSPVGGSGGDIEGTARFLSKYPDVLFRVQVKGVEVGTLLTLLVDGEEVAQSRGNAFFFHLRRTYEGTPRRGRSGALDFDPRGKEIAVSGVNGTLLSSTFGPVDDTDAQIDETVILFPSGGGPYNGWVHFSQKKGVRKLAVNVEGVEDGELAVFVGGIEQGSTEAAAGRGSVTFSDDGNSQLEPLDFEAFGERIEVRQGSDVILSGTLMSDGGIDDGSGGSAGGTGSGPGGPSGGTTPGPVSGGGIGSGGSTAGL